MINHQRLTIGTDNLGSRFRCVFPVPEPLFERLGTHLRPLFLIQGSRTAVRGFHVCAISLAA